MKIQIRHEVEVRHIETGTYFALILLLCRKEDQQRKILEYWMFPSINPGRLESPSMLVNKCVRYPW